MNIFPQGEEIEMSREELPFRRESVLQTFEHEDPDGKSRKYTVGVGLYPDGRLGEIFLDGMKVGSDAQTLMDDAAVSVSRNLQHGDDPRRLAAAMTKRSLLRHALEVAYQIVGNSAEIAK